MENQTGVHQSQTLGSHWRADAARIVEEMFPVTSPEVWDDLLELRGLLLSGRNWARALDLFLDCRRKLESDLYLPFYRLRMLLAGSLRLEAGAEPVGNLSRLMRRKHASFESLKRALDREQSYRLDEGDFLRIVEAV